MMRRCICVGLLLSLALVSPLAAFDAVGTIKKIDTENQVVDIFANGQDRQVKLAKDIKVLDKEGKPLADGLKSKDLKEGTEVTVTVDRVNNEPTISVIRLGKTGGGEAKQPTGGKASVGFKPLTEMSATDKYKGEDGGLYGAGKNDPPEGHLAAAKKETAKIEPLNAEGKPAKDGKIGLVSISMSNATQEFSYFKQIADKDNAKSPLVAIVDCAQGGQAMAQWVDPQANPWKEAARRLQAANVSNRQVQVVWIKLANVAPTGGLEVHGKKLQKDTLAVIQNAKAKFPNLRVAYLGSRIYGGWSDGRLNPEPYAYEGAFPVRWLIQDQIKGADGLSIEKGQAPILLWGPYLWADGTTPRQADKLIWERKDLAGDGTHPSQTGREKVADMLLKFFKTDPLASAWFVKK